MQRQHKEALGESRVQEALFSDFRSKLDAENVRAWEAEVEAYEQDPKTQRDPYFRETTGKKPANTRNRLTEMGLVLGVTEAEARLQLAEEDSLALEAGEVALHDLSPAGMILEMLEIEDLQ